MQYLFVFLLAISCTIPLNAVNKYILIERWQILFLTIYSYHLYKNRVNMYSRFLAAYGTKHPCRHFVSGLDFFCAHLWIYGHPIKFFSLCKVSIKMGIYIYIYQIFLILSIISSFQILIFFLRRESLM